MRDIGKDLRNLQLALMESNDKPIFYISRSFGNKYIVPQEEFEKLTKENVEYKRVLEIIKEKRVDCQLIRIADNVEWYNKEYIYRHEIEYLNRDEVLTYQISQEEFDLLKRWLGNER